MKPQKTWIVLADAASVRVAVNEGPGKGVYGVSAGGLAAAPVTALSDAPGITNASVGPNRGGISDPDLKGQAAAAFADDIIRFLEAEKAGDAFQRLVLVAPPSMLGLLRQRLTQPLRAVLRADIDKDLTHVSLKDLPRYLGDVLVI